MIDKINNKQSGMIVLPDYADTTTEERAIDILVYKLYELTEEEIAIVEGK